MSIWASKKTYLLGTSGGAWAAINMALLRPDLVSRIVADSMGDDAALAQMAPHIPKERLGKFKDPFTRLFWRYNHGRNWKKIVQADSDMILYFAESGHRIFCREPDQINCPVLLTGCTNDELIPDIARIHQRFTPKIPQAEVRLFTDGGNSAVLTKRKWFLEAAIDFLQDN